MLVLTFQIGEEALGLDIRRVEEVIPRVNLRQVNGAPPWLAGVFVYRGDIVPVVDLHHLAGAPPCPFHLSSRIILTRLPGPGAERRLVGLLASRVDETREVEPTGKCLPGVSDRVDLGPVFAVAGGTLRLFDPDRFLPPASVRQLFGQAREDDR